MECFHHAGTAAAGVCKACGRGLCRECARVDGGWIHCEGECGTYAGIMRRVLTQSSGLKKAAPRVGLAIAALVFLLGACLLGLGIDEAGAPFRLVSYVGGGATMLFSAVLGIVLLKASRTDPEGPAAR